MTREKLFMAAQAALCAVIAALLAAGALSLYLDGAAKQSEGDLFYYMFTRERVGVKLIPILPLLFCAVGLTIAGMIGTNISPNVLRILFHTGAILRTAVLVVALILIVIGIINGGLEDVLAKGAAICTECVGLG